MSKEKIMKCVDELVAARLQQGWSTFHERTDKARERLEQQVSASLLEAEGKQLSVKTLLDKAKSKLCRLLP